MTAAMTQPTMLQAIQKFYKNFDLPADGGNSSNWVRIQLGPVPLFFPNFDARREVVTYHDAHHVVTDYPATVLGECKISAWEVAAGCGRYWAAWFYNTLGILTGMVIAPRITFQAFVRGRNCRSLYGMDERKLLTMTVDELSTLTGADAPTPPPTRQDWLAFLSWAALGVTLVAAPVAALMAII